MLITKKLPFKYFVISEKLYNLAISKNCHLNILPFQKKLPFKYLVISKIMPFKYLAIAKKLSYIYLVISKKKSRNAIQISCVSSGLSENGL